METHKTIWDLDRTAFSVADLEEQSDEGKFWSAKTPQERFEAIEVMRQVVYGYNPATERLQRFFEVAEFPASTT